MKRFFAYCPDMGFYLFDTAEDAEAHTRRDIPEHLDECWSEEVESVCWGEVRQIAAVVSRVGHARLPAVSTPTTLPLRRRDHATGTTPAPTTRRSNTASSMSR